MYDTLDMVFSTQSFQGIISEYYISKRFVNDEEECRSIRVDQWLCFTRYFAFEMTTPFVIFNVTDCLQMIVQKV